MIKVLEMLGDERDGVRMMDYTYVAVMGTVEVPFSGAIRFRDQLVAAGVEVTGIKEPGTPLELAPLDGKEIP